MMLKYWSELEEQMQQFGPLPRASADYVALFHYATRSREDFEIKQARGQGGSKVGRPWTFFNELERCAWC